MALGSKAHFLYGQNTPSSFTTDLVPRSKYNFKVSMTHRTPAALGGLTTTDFERISSVSMPGLSVKTNTLNQYNRKRVVQTGIEYAPITMLAYDDRRGDFEKFLKEYTEYYYAGSMNYGDSFVAFNNAQSGTKLQDNKNFITQFTIERVNSASDTSFIKVYNPMITNIDADTLDYSDSGLVQYRITFMYEGYDISTDGYVSPQHETKQVELGPSELSRGNNPATSVQDSLINPPEPSLFEQEDDLVETTRPVDDDIVDNRTEEEKTPPPLAPQAVDNSAINKQIVLATATDATGNAVEQVIEETTFDKFGDSTTTTYVQPTNPADDRRYDEYVGVPVEDIPEDALDAIASSGSYYQGEDGTLKNTANDRTFNEINREALDTTRWVNNEAVRGVGFDDTRKQFRAYNSDTNSYAFFDDVHSANQYAVATPVAFQSEESKEATVLAQSVAPSMTEEQLRLEGRKTQAPQVVQAPQSMTIPELKDRVEASGNEFVEQAPMPPAPMPAPPVTESFVDVDNDPIHYGGVTQDMIDEGQVLAQSVAPSMSEEELRAQGSQTPMPQPNPDLIERVNNFDSDGDPINNTDDSED